MPPHPPWYSIFARTASLVTLTAHILKHAAEYTEAARKTRQILRAEEQSELLRFEDVEDNGVDDDDSMCSEGSVATDASFSAHLNSGSSWVFKTPKLRPKQDEAVKRIVLDPMSGGRLIVVDRTGGGKSLILLTPHDRDMRRSRDHDRDRSSPCLDRQSARSDSEGRPKIRNRGCSSYRRGVKVRSQGEDYSADGRHILRGFVVSDTPVFPTGVGREYRVPGSGAQMYQEAHVAAHCHRRGTPLRDARLVFPQVDSCST